MRVLISVLFIGLFTGANTFAAASKTSYTFMRDLSEGSRGGNTIGPDVELDLEIPRTWKDLQEKDITNYERDRRAILALQGEFEVSFEFIESFLMDTQKERDIPYFSKATEFVKVIEDRGDFISLQHILVMFFKVGDQVQGPMVVKHWRQDWQWNASERFIFQGSKKWDMVTNSNKHHGKWTWNVYQVDDSPRYSGVGKWNHMESASFFESNMMSRPLPRREFSVRNDYKLLMGQETLVVTAHNWYHEQKAFKHQGNLKEGKFHGKLLAREIGQNTYKRIKNFDWSAGLKYWDKTQGYWSDVRSVWKDLFKQRGSVELRGQVDGVKLHAKHFKQAEDPNILRMSSESRQNLIKKTILQYVK